MSTCKRRSQWVRPGESIMPQASGAKGLILFLYPELMCSRGIKWHWLNSWWRKHSVSRLMYEKSVRQLKVLLLGEGECMAADWAIEEAKPESMLEVREWKNHLVIQLLYYSWCLTLTANWTWSKNHPGSLERLSKLGWPISMSVGYWDYVHWYGKTCPLWVSPFSRLGILYCVRRHAKYRNACICSLLSTLTCDYDFLSPIPDALTSS